MGERREFPRLVAAIEASYQVEGSVLGRRATLSALSAGGASLVADEMIEPGVALDYLRFTLGDEPTTSTFQPAAEVKSCERRAGIGRGDEYLVGVEFKGVSLAEVREIDDLVVERLARLEAGYSPRIEIETQVAVRFDRFDRFVAEVSKNLSKTGMFIQSGQPHPAGSEFEFVLQLGEDFNLVQGRAEVVWSRAKAEGPDRPPGMGIRFLSLDKTSEGVLSRLIAAHIEPSYPRALESPASDDLLELPDPDPPEPPLQ